MSAEIPVVLLRDFALNNKRLMIHGYVISRIVIKNKAPHRQNRIMSQYSAVFPPGQYHTTQ